MAPAGLWVAGAHAGSVVALGTFFVIVYCILFYFILF
jgi:hypothetical protein